MLLCIEAAEINLNIKWAFIYDYLKMIDISNNHLHDKSRNEISFATRTKSRISRLKLSFFQLCG